MAKPKKPMKARAAAKKKPVAKKKPRGAEIAAKQQPKALTPKQFAAKLKAEQKEAKAKAKAELKAGKAAPVAAAPGDGKLPKTRQRLTAKEKALVREFERKEL